MPQKSVEQQAMLSLHRTRQHWVSVRTATVNALRGLLYEFGVVLRGGRRAGLKALAEQRGTIDAQLPATMRSLVDGQLRMLGQVDARIDELEREIAALQQQVPGATKLDQISGSVCWVRRRWPPRSVTGCLELGAAVLGQPRAGTGARRNRRQGAHRALEQAR